MSTLIDHTLDAAFRASRAARYLVSFQSFGTPGLVKPVEGDRSAKASPLMKNMVVLVRGATLFETLLLNLHQYDPDAGIPFEGSDADLAAWERDDEPYLVERIPGGYVDLLTWQSRSLRLIPETEADEVRVRQVVVAKGEQFSPVFERHVAETMVPFVKIEKPRVGEPAYQPLAIRPDRAVWRDSSALLQSLSGVRVRPRMFDWLGDLSTYGYIESNVSLPVDVYGIVNDQARIVLWRREHLPVPTPYLSDELLLQALGATLTLAEEVSRVLYRTTRTLMEFSLAPTRDQPGGRKPDAAELRSLTDKLVPTQSYWSRLEPRFRDMMIRLVGDRTVDEYDSVRYGEQVLPEWRETVRTTALEAFRGVARGLGTSPRTVKALAIAERDFNRELKQVTDEWLKQPEEEVVS